MRNSLNGLGTNCGIIFLRVPGKVAVPDVVDAITGSYVRRGARRATDEYRADLAPLTLSDPGNQVPGVLGIGISPMMDRWMSIVDSEQYYADAALARDLAAALKTTTFWEFTGDVSQSHAVARFGKAEEWSSCQAPLQPEYRDLEHADRQGWTFLTFDGVAPES
jgi:hypothetical protein